MKTDHAIISALIAHVTSECSAVDMESRYDSMLDEIYGECFTGPFQYLQPSRVMKEMQPTDYRCGFADFTDSEDVYEIEGGYYDEKEVNDAWEAFADDLESELSDLETELEEASEEEEVDTETVKELEAKIAAKQEEVDAVRAYSF